MYSIVEFERKQCSIVPLSWLIDDNSKCYWPKAFTEEKFTKFVKEKKDPLPTWSKYNVVKVYYVTESYEDADLYLQKILDQSTSTSSDGVNVTNLPLKEFSKPRLRSDSEETRDLEGSTLENSLNDGGTEKRDISVRSNNNFRTQKRARTCSESGSSSCEELSFRSNKSCRTKTRSTSASSSCTSEEENLRKSKSRCKDVRSSQTHAALTNQSRKQSGSSRSVVFESNTLQLQSPSTSNSLASTVTVASSSTDTSVSLRSNGLNDLIVRSLKNLEYAVNQNSLKIDNLLRIQQTTVGHSLSTPSDMPKLPADRRHDLKNVEAFLKKAEHFQYLKCRLACVGGSNVRNCVMNMLKFLMSNKLAMKYNWAGRDQNKKPFKHLTLMQVISDATRQAFINQQPSDLTDKTITDAVKDWLRLARARYEYSQRRVPK